MLTQEQAHSYKNSNTPYTKKITSPPLTLKHNKTLLYLQKKFKHYSDTGTPQSRHKSTIVPFTDKITTFYNGTKRATPFDDTRTSTLFKLTQNRPTPIH